MGIHVSHNVATSDLEESMELPVQILTTSMTGRNAS
jgi:hypothetical protein